MDINKLLKEAVEKKASDLHLSPDLHPILRIDGQLVTLTDYPVMDEKTCEGIITGLMAPDQIKILNEAKQVDFSLTKPELAGFRINAYRMINGLAAVFRIIPHDVPTLDQLGSPAIFKKLLDLSSGLILVTGTTGSGKTTTLAAMVDYINTNRNRHIITIEDPVEFIHTSKKSLISQRQAYRDAMDFTSALTAALREDPDVILIGEMRDLKTIRMALRAAETGHLVIATLHTSSAPRAISRIVDVFPTGEKNIIRNLLSELLQAVICQTLLKKQSGGRVAAYEIMVTTNAIRNLIREDKLSQIVSAMQTGMNKGMCLMQQSIDGLVAQGVISRTSVVESGFQRELAEETTEPKPFI